MFVHWWGVGTVWVGGWGGGGLMISHVHSNIVLTKVECKAIFVAEIVFPIMIVLMLTIQCCSLRGIRQSLEGVSKSIPMSTCIVQFDSMQIATCSLCLARRMEGGLGRRRGGAAKKTQCILLCGVHLAVCLRGGQSIAK